MTGPMTGAMLKHVRETLKLSAPEMAALICVNLRTYYRYEKAKAVDLTAARLVVTLLKSPAILHGYIADIRGASK